MEIPQFPLIFTRLSTCLSGPSSNIEMRSDLVDYEAELVFVIGKGGKNISKRTHGIMLQVYCRTRYIR